MAVEIIKGLGVVWSTGGLSIAGTGVYATGKIQSVKYDLDGKTVEVNDENGDVAAVVFYADNEKMTIEVVPTGASVSAAVACNILPARGADITITDTADSETNSAVFMFMGGSKNRTSEGVATLTMNLERKGGATLSTIS